MTSLSWRSSSTRQVTLTLLSVVVGATCSLPPPARSSNCSQRRRAFTSSKLQPTPSIRCKEAPSLSSMVIIQSCTPLARCISFVVPCGGLLQVPTSSCHPSFWEPERENKHSNDCFTGYPKCFLLAFVFSRRSFHSFSWLKALF